MELAKEIKLRRFLREMSQYEVVQATKGKVTQTELSLFENGYKKLGPEKLDAVLHVLGLTSKTGVSKLFQQKN